MTTEQNLSGNQHAEECLAAATTQQHAQLNNNNNKITRSKRRESATPRHEKFFVYVDEEEEIGYMSWKEVAHCCLCHTFQEWFSIFVGICTLLACLYFFGLGLDFLGSGAKVMGGCAAGQLFGDTTTNPVAGLMVGILATVLLQSSSTTTSIIVGLAGNDSHLISVQQGIYMIMGSNIGTSITGNLVSFAHLGDSAQMELAFAAATIHDMFNILTVMILFPLELTTGFLYRFTSALVRAADTTKGEKWEGPVKKIIAPLGKRVLVANKKVTAAVAAGGSCDDFYPIQCDDPNNPTKATCSKTGLIGCDKKSGECPAFFQATASRHGDQISGFVVFAMGLFIIVFILLALVQVLQRLLVGTSTRAIYKVTNMNEYFLIFIGTGITMIFQSSSTTTSLLTPIAGMGLLRLEQVFPLIVGANLGTTISALLAALVTEGQDALQIALAHLLFNISGMLIWFPIPIMRNVPIYLAKQLGKSTKLWFGLPWIYTAVVFLIIPSIVLLVATLFMTGEHFFIVIATILTAIIICSLLRVIYWFAREDGKAKFFHYFTLRQERVEAIRSLHDSIEYIKIKIVALKKHTKLQFKNEGSSPSSTASSTVSIEDNNDNNIINNKYNCFGGRASNRQKTKRALQRLPNDLRSINNALKVLIVETKLPKEVDSDDMRNNDMECGRMLSSNNDNDPQECNDNSRPFDVYNDDEAVTILSVVKTLSTRHQCMIVLSTATYATVVAVLWIQDAVSFHCLAVFLCFAFVSCFLVWLYWLAFDDGSIRMLRGIINRQNRKMAIDTLHHDMVQIKSDLRQLQRHVGLISNNNNHKRAKSLSSMGKGTKRASIWENDSDSVQHK